MDILNAIANAQPSRGDSRCGLARWLDGIPADTPGREELIRLVETRHARQQRSEDSRSAGEMVLVLVALGFPITEGPIHDHRNHRCRCYR